MTKSVLILEFEEKELFRLFLEKGIKRSKKYKRRKVQNPQLLCIFVPNLDFEKKSKNCPGKKVHKRVRTGTACKTQFTESVR